MNRLLAHTPGLEELEYYWHICPRRATELYTHLCPAKATLKRLCVSFLSWPACDLGSQPWFWYDFVDAKVRPIEFELLEDITIDYRTLYRENDEDELDGLTRFLPASIRRLRIAYVAGKNLTEALRELAAVAEEMFPKLTSVTIGVPKWPDGRPDYATAMRWEVEPLFRGRGYSLRLGEGYPRPQSTHCHAGRHQAGPATPALEGGGGGEGERSRRRRERGGSYWYTVDLTEGGK